MRTHSYALLSILLVGGVARGEPATTLRAGKAALNQAAYTGDGKQLATAGFDKVVRSWDGATGKEVRAFTGAPDLVDAVAISPDGQRIVAGSRDGTLISWTADGSPAFTVRGHTGAIWGVRFDPSGTRLVTASADGTVKIWDAKSGREQRTLKHKKAAWLAVFTADGKRIASASFDSTVRLWDAKTGKATRTLTGHTKEVLAVDVSPDGKLVASGGNDKTLRVHDAKTGKLLKELVQPDVVNSVAFSPDGKWLAVGVGDPVELGPKSEVALLDTAGWTSRTKLTAACGILFNVTVRPDGAQLAAACADGSIQMWAVRKL